MTSPRGWGNSPNSTPWVFDWRELSHACLHQRANLFNFVATLKDFEIFHEFNYFVSLLFIIVPLWRPQIWLIHRQSVVTCTFQNRPRNWRFSQSGQSGKCQALMVIITEGDCELDAVALELIKVCWRTRYYSHILLYKEMPPSISVEPYNNVLQPIWCTLKVLCECSDTYRSIVIESKRQGAIHLWRPHGGGSVGSGSGRRLQMGGGGKAICGRPYTKL